MSEIEAIKPKFECLGVLKHGKLAPTYYFRAHDGHVFWRRAANIRLVELMMLVPDAAHWRALFPRPGTSRGNKIDTLGACGALMIECEKAGPYWPDDPELLPQNVPKPNPTVSALANRKSYAAGKRRRKECPAPPGEHVSLLKAKLLSLEDLL